jgi:hypothetical protein
MHLFALIIGALTSVLALGVPRHAFGLAATDVVLQHSSSSSQNLDVIAPASTPVALVVPGAGVAGPWDTEIVLANPTGVQLDGVSIGQTNTGCSINECPPPQPIVVSIPANGQIRVIASETSLFLDGQVSFLLVGGAINTPAIPTIRVRVFDTLQPSRAMELPVVSVETLAGRTGLPFVFPGALRSNSGYSNLVISEINGSGAAVVRLEAFDDTGVSIGSVDRTIQSFRTLFLGDVLQSVFSVSNFSGQIRVTQIGGSGIIDGALATLTSDGGFAVSSGFNP